MKALRIAAFKAAKGRVYAERAGGQGGIPVHTVRIIMLNGRRMIAGDVHDAKGAIQCLFHVRHMHIAWNKPGVIADYEAKQVEYLARMGIDMASLPVVGA